MGHSVHAGPVELPNALVEEGAAGGTYLPGNIVVKNGDNLDVGIAATTGLLLIASENGPGVGGHIDDAFVVGAPVQAYKARQGLYFRARLATGQALVKGQTELERGAAGRLVVKTTGVAVAVAKETVTTTANDELALVEVL